MGPRVFGSFMGRLMQGFVLTAAGSALAMGLPQAAHAHAIESTLSYLNGTLELRSSFSTGEPAAGALVRMLEEDGTPGAALGQIDQNGVVQLTLPALSEGTVDLQIDGGPGHRDYLTLPIENGAVQLDAVTQHPAGHPRLLALLGTAGAAAGLYGGLVLVGRVRRSRPG